MTTPTPESDRPTITREMVRGFVDGELTRDEHDAVLEALMSDPAVADLVQTERKLRNTLAGCMDCQITMRCPDALKARLAEICDDDDDARPDNESAEPETAPPATIGRVGGDGWGRSALALAAVFLAAATLIAVVVSRGGSGDGALPGPDAAMLPAGLPMQFAKRHVLCTTGVVDLMQEDAVPNEIEPLTAALAQRFGASPGSMDLSSMGYRLSKTGECYVPGVGAVHAIYVADADSRHDAVSLWVIDHDAERAMKPGRVYNVIDHHMPNPMVMWTDGSLDYYAVGDDYEAISALPPVVDPDGVSAAIDERAIAVNY
ncbi:MAG: hypothetical protein AAF586_08300 [Planctomycetota bacterium]